MFEPNPELSSVIDAVVAEAIALRDAGRRFWEYDEIEAKYGWRPQSEGSSIMTRVCAVLLRHKVVTRRMRTKLAFLSDSDVVHDRTHPGVIRRRAGKILKEAGTINPANLKESEQQKFALNVVAAKQIAELAAPRVLASNPTVPPGGRMVLDQLKPARG